MVAIGIHAEGVEKQFGGDEKNHGVHDRGDGEGSGERAEGEGDSDRPRSGKDNRERLLEDEIGELRVEVERLWRTLFFVFLVALVGFALAFLGWRGIG